MKADASPCIFINNVSILSYYSFRSHNGTFIATGGTAGVLRVWRFDSSKLVSAVVAHSGNINGVSFTPDDRQILTVGDDGCINVWCLYSDDA